MDYVIIIIAKHFYLLVILLAVAGVALLHKKEKYNLLKLSVLTFPLSFLTAKVLSKFIYDPRPFVVEHIHPLISHAADNGFPSDHTLLTMTIASVLFAYNKKMGIFLAILSLIVGISRIIAKVHHPLDIIGSVVIAVVATYIAWRILKIKSVRKILNYYSDRIKNL